MKPLIFAALMCVTTVAAAHGPGWHRYQQHHHHYHGSRADWIVPAIIGGAVVYAATRPAQPTVVYVPQGMPPPPPGFKYEQIHDASCNCVRWVLTQG